MVLGHDFTTNIPTTQKPAKSGLCLERFGSLPQFSVSKLRRRGITRPDQGRGGGEIFSGKFPLLGS